MDLFVLLSSLAGIVFATTIKSFFDQLLSEGLQPAATAIAIFFIAWGAIELMLPGERNQDRAKSALFRAGVGLAIFLLAGTIASIIENATK